MSEVLIRRLQGTDDLIGATDLLIRFFHEEQFDTPDDLIGRNLSVMAGFDNCGIFIAEVASQAVGIATVSLEFGIEFGWGGEMGDLYVLPEWRGREISRRLVSAVEDHLQQRGVASYQVTLTPYARDTHDLKTYYAKLGFSHEGRLILAKKLPGNLSERK